MSNPDKRRREQIQERFRQNTLQDTILATVSGCGSYERLSSALDKKAASVEAAGLAGSLRSITLAGLLVSRPGLILLEDLNDAEDLYDDLVQILGKERTHLLPVRELMPYDQKALPVEQRSELMDILRRLRMGEKLILVAGVRQIASRYPDKRVFDRGLYHIEVGMSLDREELLSELDAAGFTRESAVEDISQYSLRGGILDIYPWGLEYPIRLEFFGDEIESIRAFDPSTQTSTERLPAISLVIQSGNTWSYDTSLFDLLHRDTLFVLPPQDSLFGQVDFVHQEALRAWRHLENRDTQPAPAEKYLSVAQIREGLAGKRNLWLHPTRQLRDTVINFQSRQQESYLRNIDLLVNNISAMQDEGYSIHILCDNNGQLERLQEILEEDHELPPGTVKLSIGSLHHGFVHHDAKLVVLTDHEIFGRPRHRKHTRRFRRATALRKIENLEPGDSVVHVKYGIGIFEGLTTISVANVEREVLKIRYSKEDRIYVRLENFRDVEKYSAQEGCEPKLSSLGSGEWERTKKRTTKSIQKIAQELVELYAKRRLSSGHACGPDTVWQREMEAAFEFVETGHQLEAIDAVKQDMERPWPMDRLICGDVGFGKTEVAVRAAFKAVCDGKQVAILVPTTILAQQHFNTFSQRFAEFPVTVDVISRFRTKAEQTEILSKVQRGSIDVLIGTHRILSKDIKFKDLGLLVVDEEQRFGVLHKERIKQMRANVDVMTMTATPIPRTLNMALMGIKDLSLVNEPPSNRLPIETEIVAFNKRTIRSAILRELDRDGQVYFVHNRVQTIDTMKQMLQELIPEARFEVGHGQMSERQLEKIMLGFMRRKFDVLISTMIIETGLDIPNVNTMIVNRADSFGLSQLYQLRGRIGRSHRQAYAHLLTPPHFQMKQDARKRLFTIGEFTDLGSGFKIAMRDMEIRGAGNLLGEAQSGFITAVGYELYNRLLEEAILALRSEEGEQEQLVSRGESQIELPMDALLPADYVDDPGERVNLYRRLLQSSGQEELQKLQHEVVDRFGRMPHEAMMLFTLVELQKLAREAEIRVVDLRADPIRLSPWQSQSGDGQRYLRLLQHLDPSWPLELRSSPDLQLLLPRQGRDLSFAIDVTRRLLRELAVLTQKDRAKSAGLVKTAS